MPRTKPRGTQLQPESVTGSQIDDASVESEDLATELDGGLLVSWEDHSTQVFSSGDHVVHLNKLWVATASTTSGDIPGTSSLWKDASESDSSRYILTVDVILSSGATSGTLDFDDTVDLPDSGSPQFNFSFIARDPSSTNITFLLKYAMSTSEVNDVVLGAYLDVNGSTLNSGSPRTVTISPPDDTRQSENLSPSPGTGVYIDSTEFSDGDLITVRFYRDAANGLDTHTGTVKVLSIEVV